jgi:hypothetical protein
VNKLLGCLIVTGGLNLFAQIALGGTIIGNLSPSAWLYGAEMTHGYSFTPNAYLQVTAVRGYSTDRVSIWTDSGTLLASQYVSAPDSWTESALLTSVTLAAGTTYRVSAHIPAGDYGYFRQSSWPTVFANGTVGQNFYYSYGDVFPTSVYRTGQGRLVDLRYVVVPEPEASTLIAGALLLLFRAGALRRRPGKCMA